MPVAVNGYASSRTGTGLLITAAIHVALGAALLSLGVVELSPTITAPIKLKNVPDQAPPVEKVEPMVTDDPVVPMLDAPILDIAVDLPPAPDTAPRGAVPVPSLPPIDRGIVAPPAAPEAMVVGARLDPRYASRFQPPYPSASKRMDEEGVVIVRVRVGSDGRVVSAELKASSGHARLDEAAIEHARRTWRFVPATRDGVAIESWREVPVRFELKNG